MGGSNGDKMLDKAHFYVRGGCPYSWKKYDILAYVVVFGFLNTFGNETLIDVLSCILTCAIFIKLIDGRR